MKVQPARCPCCNQLSAKHGSLGLHIEVDSNVGYTYTICLACTKRNRTLSHVGRQLTKKRTLQRMMAAPNLYACVPHYADRDPMSYFLDPRLGEMYARVTASEPAFEKPSRTKKGGAQ
jgi:hypothetical protein